MTIGSMTPTLTPAVSLLASIGSSGPAAPAGEATTGAGAGLFSSILRDELQVVAGALGQPAGAAAEPASGTTTSTAAATDASTTDASTTDASTTGASATDASTTGVSTPTAAAATTDAAPSGHCYVVTYVHGQQAVSSGQTTAPLVKGPTGGLVITAKTTGLTQLTRRFTGTVAHPTAAAEATATTMAAIASLKAAGQA